MNRQKSKENDSEIVVPVLVNDGFPKTLGFAGISSVENTERHKLILSTRCNSSHFIVSRSDMEVEIIKFLNENGIRAEKILMRLDDDKWRGVINEVVNYKNRLGEKAVADGLLREFMGDESLRGQKDTIKDIIKAVKKGRYPGCPEILRNKWMSSLYLIEREAPSISTLSPSELTKLDVKKVLKNVADMIGRMHSLDFNGCHIQHGHPHGGNITVFPNNTVGLIDFTESYVERPDWGNANSILSAFSIDYSYLNSKFLNGFRVNDDLAKREFFEKLVSHYPLVGNAKEKRGIRGALVEYALNSHI
ncbi:MAG: hypothetical protein V1744_03865 [Candidatus Altiarchaeota archaeon]